MSNTRAAAWQWMQMLPLTLWSLPPAVDLHQHSTLPGSGCRCCPHWRVQNLLFLPDCVSLHSDAVQANVVLWPCKSLALNIQYIISMYFYTALFYLTIAQVSLWWCFPCLPEGTVICFDAQCQSVKKIEMTGNLTAQVSFDWNVESNKSKNFLQNPALRSVTGRCLFATRTSTTTQTKSIKVI